MPSQHSERRHIAILDGAQRFELAMPAGARLGDALAAIDVTVDPVRQALVGAGGAGVALDLTAESLLDGAVLTIIDLNVVPSPGVPAATADAPFDAGGTAAWWLLGGIGVLAAAIALLVPAAFPPSLRAVTSPVLAIAALAAAVSLAVLGTRRAGAVAALAPLALAFGAGVCAVSVLPAATAQVAVLVGLVFAAVLAALLAVIVGEPAVRAGLATGAMVLVAVAALWSLVFFLGLSASAAAVVIVGAVPVVLRALPSALLEVPAGMFIDHARYQRTLWSVRQQLPAPGGRVMMPQVRRLVDDSASRLVVGTAALSLAAALGAPLAVPGFALGNPLVLVGQIVVLPSVALSLLLGARRSTLPVLHWMPRLAAFAVLGAGALAVIRAAPALFMVVSAIVLLVAALGSAVLAVPEARGTTALVWSRVGDVIEWLAVVLAFPAGLLAAGVVDLVRGMMGG